MYFIFTSLVVTLSESPSSQTLDRLVPCVLEHTPPVSQKCPVLFLCTRGLCALLYWSRTHMWTADHPNWLKCMTLYVLAPGWVTICFSLFIQAGVIGKKRQIKILSVTEKHSQLPKDQRRSLQFELVKASASEGEGNESCVSGTHRNVVSLWVVLFKEYRWRDVKERTDKRYF